MYWASKIKIGEYSIKFRDEFDNSEPGRWRLCIFVYIFILLDR